VIAASGDAAPQNERQLLDGVPYDAVLCIDVSDDAPPLQLGLNAAGAQKRTTCASRWQSLTWRNADDAHEAALAFVAKHSLPDSYVAQIEDFIQLVAPRVAR
jgi:hypothetical protein